MKQKFPIIDDFNHLSISRSSAETDMTEAEIFELRILMAQQGKTLTQDDIDYINTKRRANARRGVTTPQYQAVLDDFINNLTIS